MFKVAKGGQMKIRNKKIKRGPDGKVLVKNLAPLPQVTHYPVSHIQSMGAYRSPGFQLENPPEPPRPSVPLVWIVVPFIFLCVYTAFIVALFSRFV
jgi:hypothetical protein